MRQSISRLLRRLHIIRFDLLIDHEPALPHKTSISGKSLTLVESGGVKKWACLRCPGGCGEIINLSLNPNQRPRWAVSEDFWMRPTVFPSVHQKNPCKCHFWINRGSIRWCKNGRPRTEGIIPSDK